MSKSKDEQMAEKIMNAKGDRNLKDVVLKESGLKKIVNKNTKKELAENKNNLPVQTSDKKGATELVDKTRKEDRNEYIISLYLMGYSPKTILTQVNKLAETRNWGTLSLINSIRRILYKYADENKINTTIQDSSERFLAIDRLNNIVERFARYISKRETEANKKIDDKKVNKDAQWKPFEYSDALEKLFKMQQQIVENMNWNASRANPLIAIQNNFSQLSIFDKEGSEYTNLVNRPKSILSIIEKSKKIFEQDEEN